MQFRGLIRKAAVRPKGCSRSGCLKIYGRSFDGGSLFRCVLVTCHGLPVTRFIDDEKFFLFSEKLTVFGA